VRVRHGLATPGQRGGPSTSSSTLQPPRPDKAGAASSHPRSHSINAPQPTLTPDQRIARCVDFVAPHTIGSSPAGEAEITNVLIGWISQNQELARVLSWPELLEQFGALADQAGYVTAEQRLKLEKPVAQATHQRNRRLGNPWGSKAAAA